MCRAGKTCVKPEERVNASGVQAGSPVFGLETYGDAAIHPLYDGALDDAGVRLQQGSGRSRIGHLGLHGSIELAPGRALAVGQLFPAYGLHPGCELLGGYAQLLEVVEFVVQPLCCQPGACFFTVSQLGMP